MKDICKLSFTSLLLAAALSPIFAGAADRERQLHLYMRAASASVDAGPKYALGEISDTDRRNLAMTYYLRAGSTIQQRWSWTREQISAYYTSTDFLETQIEIDKIKQRFAADNPPYELYVNVEVRSLEEQLARWQTVRSVGIAAVQLREAALEQLQVGAYTAEPTAKAVEQFAQFLRSWRASPSPTLAAPGLSLHGRGRAYDFQIQDQTGRMIASADTSKIQSIWESQKWAERLSRAVHAASDKFVGPLHGEPWHYEYRP